MILSVASGYFEFLTLDVSPLVCWLMALGDSRCCKLCVRSVSAGFPLNDQLFQMIIRRYSDENGNMDFDNFIGCLVRLNAMCCECMLPCLVSVELWHGATKPMMMQVQKEPCLSAYTRCQMHPYLSDFVSLYRLPFWSVFIFLSLSVIVPHLVVPND